MKRMAGLKQVSVIIPAYNEEVFLPACLESIANVDYPKELLEVIVVDNGSTDKTINIALSFGVEILVDEKANVSRLRNLGAKSARGDILAFVDADCTVSKNWLRSAIKYFELPDVALWGAPARIPRDSTWVQQTWFIVRKRESRVQEVEWLESMNLFARRNQFLSVNGFDESLDTCEDVDFCYRMRRFGKIISDANIEVIHHGEARTIIEFIKKEVWRGSGNLKGVFKHGFILKELPSLFIPLYFGFFLPALFFVGVCYKDPWLIKAGLLLLFLPTVVGISSLVRKISSFSDIARLFVLLNVYFFARTVAIFKR